MPHIPRIMCLCGREMKPATIGLTLNVHTRDGEPYYLIKADRLRCVGCGAGIYLVAHQEFAQHFEENYSEQAEDHGAIPVTLA